MSNQQTSPDRALALGGLLVAGNIAVLWLACLTPTGWLGLTAAAGLFPVVGVLSAGRKTGYLCWAAASVLAFLQLPDKAIALLYLLFFGVYPVLKSWIEAKRSVFVQWCFKLAVFQAALSIVIWFFLELFLPALPPWLGEGRLPLYGLGNVLFICYDFGLSRLIAVLQARLRRGMGR